MSKVTSLSENGYIFCIINDKIYIFDENGNLLSLNCPKILLTDETADYYTLAPILKTDNYYDYVIGYVYKCIKSYIIFI